MSRYFPATLCAALVLLCAGAVPALAQDATNGGGGVGAYDPTTQGVPLTGRVVTPDGAPEAKVDVHITIKSPFTFRDPNSGNVTQTTQVSARDLKTDDQGYYKTTGIKPGDTVIIFVNDPGYQYISGGQLGVGAGGYLASDMVAAPPVARVFGTVYDSSGAPVAGAEVVAPSANPTATAISDATGHFELDSLPSGQVNVIAAGLPGVGGGQYATGVAITVTLTPVRSHDDQDISNGTSILTGAYKQALAAQYPPAERMVMDLAGYDPAAALQLASTRGTTTADTTLYAIAIAVARANPTRAVVVAPDIVGKIVSPGMRATAAAYVGLYVAGVDNDTAERLLDIAKKALLDSTFESYGGSDRAAVAALAFKLGDRGGMKLLDDTMRDLSDVVGKLKKDPRNNIDPDAINTQLANYADTVAPAGSAMIERVLAQITVPAGGIDPRLVPRTRAIEKLAEFDASDALGMLRRYDPSEVGAPLFGEAACAVLAKLTTADAAGALALAQMVTDQQHVPVALALAARLQPADSAAPLFRNAMAAAMRDTQKSAMAGWVAAQAWEVDSALGKELFTSAWQQLSTFSTLNGGLSPFLFYYYRVDPVQSRITAEREFANAALADRITDVSEAMLTPVLAISAMDPDRAVALADTIPGPTRFEALRKVGQYLLAPPLIKRTLRFDRWQQLDGWTPGRPTGT